MDADRLHGPSDDCPNISAATPRKKKQKEAYSETNPSRKGQYKKLLWFKQPFPDNYTDEETFLDTLQLNPMLQPYEFWPLMMDATVIVQHLASVVVFCCCFVAIFDGRLSPVTVAGWASFCTFLAWILWDRWIGQSLQQHFAHSAHSIHSIHSDHLSTAEQERNEDDAHAVAAVAAASSSSSSLYSSPPLSSRTKQRLGTVKSAVLIYAALLGLSPILKSLTLSTTSDSIWALSTWLLMMNVAFFDYSGGSGSQLPASISTNSAMMASAVLASRLPSTTHVFSLTLFSIEVFGLFPIFRRQLRDRSPLGHLVLAMALTMAAWGSLFVTLTGGGRGAFSVGVVLGSIITFSSMTVCARWLIGLQKYKNEIYGPWDPARPIIRRQWD